MNTNLKMKNLFKLDNINLNYHLNGNEIKILKNISLEIKKEERVAIIGESGSGKTSLLMMMSGLEKPTTGSVFFKNKNLSEISEKEKTQIRKKNIGLIFQQFYLIPNYTALENIMFPMQINNIKDEKKKANLLLSEIGLSHRANNLPSELSGGEQQRVAIARAISFNPEIILADEPTGSLDMETAKGIFQLLKNQINSNRLIIFATHNRFFANKADCLLEMVDGNIKTING